MIEVEAGVKKRVNYIKGAPEVLLEKCKNYLGEDGERKEIPLDKLKKQLDFVTKQGIRVLLVAMNDRYDCEKMEGLTLLGFLFLKDEIRKEAYQGIELVKSAGIQTVMITGDNKETAVAIGKELGLITSSQDVVLTSTEFNQMTVEEIKEIMPRLRVVARSLPQDKSKLVRICQEMGLVVGMTGME